MVNSADLGRMLWRLFRSPAVLITLSSIIFKCSSNVPNCFCELASDTLLLFKNKWRMVLFAYFSKKYYFLGLLNWIRIETHYPLVNPLIIFYYVTIYFICWCLHCKQQTMKCHLQIVLHLISRQWDRVFPCFTQCDVFHLLPWKRTHQWRRIDITLKINNYKEVFS